MAAEEPPVLAKYQRIAWLYDLLDLPFERGRYRKIRPLMWEGLSGRILDVGVGTGRNIPYYPIGAATEIVGIDLSPAMLQQAERRSRKLHRTVELRRMDVTKLDFPDHSFDAAVATFLFCVLPEESQVPGLKELFRVVKPGGTIRLLEYVRPQGRFRGAVAKLWEPWMRWAYGAGFDRRTEHHLDRVLAQDHRDQVRAHHVTVRTEFVVADLIKLIEIRT